MCLSVWGRSARSQVEALRCHAGHGLMLVSKTVAVCCENMKHKYTWDRLQILYVLEQAVVFVIGGGVAQSV
jgi:hypothetical protein